MDKFQEFIISKFPNRSPKILFQRKRINHSEYIFEVYEVQLAWEAWQFKQDEIQKLISNWRQHAKGLCHVDDKYVIGSLLSCVNDLEKALRGEDE